MKPFHQGAGRKWIGIAGCLILGAGLFGLGYWEGCRASLHANKGTAASTNPARSFWAGANGSLPPPGANPPAADESPEMKEFLQNRATLAQKMTEMRKKGTGANGALDPKMFAQFQQENKALLDRQRELAQELSEQQAKNPQSAPPPLRIPPDATPQMTAYLTTRDQLMRDQIAFMNQHRTDDPAARQAAMQQWHQQNEARFQQLQQEAQALAQNNPPATPTTPGAATPAATTTK